MTNEEILAKEIAEPRKLSRAEEMALEAYPRDKDRELNYRRANYRIAYERGYKQAEKDLELTWEDVQKIDETICGIDVELESLPYRLGYQEYWEEVLTRFKRFKEAKK